MQPIEPAVSFMKQRGLTLIGIPLAVFLIGLIILKYALLVMPLTFDQYRELLLHIASVSATLLGLLFAAMAILFNISATKKSVYFIRLLDNLTSTTFLLFFSLFALSRLLYSTVISPSGTAPSGVTASLSPSSGLVSSSNNIS